MDADRFVQQFQLLMRCLPALKRQNTFALKGGTAINLFIQDLPRLSVDIDLTYRHQETGETAWQAIHQELLQLAETIVQMNPDVQIQRKRTHQALIQKLLIHTKKTTIKIEPSYIMRGTLLPIQSATVSRSVADRFGLFIDDVPILAPEELYAGKIAAALKRQHPRDLFDVMLMLDQEGLSTQVRQALVVYLACDNKPIHELLNPNMHDISQPFRQHFVTMTTHEVTESDLIQTRQALITKLQQGLTPNERRFLLSILDHRPRYDLLPFERLEALPALKWKRQNVQKMTHDKRSQIQQKLRRTLDL